MHPAEKNPTPVGTEPGPFPGFGHTFAPLQAKAGVADGIRTRNNKLHKLGLYR
jgi:hypothetical protein